ncbi:hypothetical protein TcYC6_0100920 [Trypanosoma cruzi]|nr:hypothetical protein TcYC6_0100920 [Trypanosoma cruzi]
MEREDIRQTHSRYAASARGFLPSRRVKRLLGSEPFHFKKKKKTAPTFSSSKASSPAHKGIINAAARIGCTLEKAQGVCGCHRPWAATALRVVGTTTRRWCLRRTTVTSCRRGASASPRRHPRHRAAAPPALHAAARAAPASGGPPRTTQRHCTQWPQAAQRQQQHDSRVRARTAVARRKVVGRAHQTKQSKQHKARSPHHRQGERIMFVKATTPAPASSTAAMQKYWTWQPPTGGCTAAISTPHTAPTAGTRTSTRSCPSCSSACAVHPLLRRRVPIPDGVQQALVQRLPRKLPVLREARAQMAGNQVAHASRERHTVQHTNDTDHAVLHAGAGHRQCEHRAKEMPMHRVRHDVRQARERIAAHALAVHAAPPLEGRRHTVVHAPEHSGEQRVAHHHPQRVKGSEHRQEVRQRNGARTLLRRGAWHPRKHAERLHLQDGAQPAGTTTATAAAPATTPVIAERTLAAAGSVFDLIVKDPSSTLAAADTATASQRMTIVSSATME